VTSNIMVNEPKDILLLRRLGMALMLARKSPPL
jgi:hypothetical protein